MAKSLPEKDSVSILDPNELGLTPEQCEEVADLIFSGYEYETALEMIRSGKCDTEKVIDTDLLGKVMNALLTSMKAID